MRQRHVAEDLPAVGAVDAGGLLDLDREVLQRGEEHQHEGAGGRPHDEQDDHRHGDAGPGEPLPPAQPEHRAVGMALGGSEAFHRPTLSPTTCTSPRESLNQVGPSMPTTLEHRVDDAAPGEQEEEHQPDRHRADHRREVERRTEEADGLQHPLVEHERQEQRERRLQRHHEQHEVEVVAQRGHEVRPRQPALRAHELLVVVGADERRRPTRTGCRARSSR